MRAIEDYPHHLHRDYGYRADIFTPDFSKFINTEDNGDEKFFKIIDTMTGAKISEIPRTILYIKKNEKYPTLKP